MARLKSEDFDKIKDKLLNVGLVSFEQKGYNATGIKEIATQAGISKGSFYSYFSSKEDFAVGVIRYYTNQSLENWKAMLELALISKDANQGLNDTFVEIIKKNQELEHKKGCLLGTLGAEISDASEECRIELRFSVNRYKELLLKYLILGQNQKVIRSDLDSDQLADLIWDCWQGSLMRMKIEKSIEPVVRDLDLLFNSLLKPCMT